MIRLYVLHARLNVWAGLNQTWRINVPSPVLSSRPSHTVGDKLRGNQQTEPTCRVTTLASVPET